MSPRRLLRQYEPPSDRAFVTFAERLLEGLASIEGAPWPRPEEELARLGRFERRLRRRFPYASVEILAGSERGRSPDPPEGRGEPPDRDARQEPHLWSGAETATSANDLPELHRGRASLAPASGIRVFRDGGRSQSLW